MFQSLSGLSLGLNCAPLPFYDCGLNVFQSLSGLSLGLNASNVSLVPTKTIRVSIPFRADTGFEAEELDALRDTYTTFQSLSGLSLGLKANTK